MRRTAFLAAIVLALAACGSAHATSTTAVKSAQSTSALTPGVSTSTTAEVGDPAFPADIEDDNRTIRIDERPEAIISLSSTATEMLFAIGADTQVVAVDDQSNYPADAPMTDLSGFTPNLEAILAYEPDLVVITFDPGDLVAGLETADVPVLTFGGAATIDDVYRQMEALGRATGNADSAAAVIEGMQAELAEILAMSTSTGEGVTYYHEIDSTFYTATSSTFFGEIYSLFGMVNAADPADEDGAAFGYPQLSAEFVVSADPNIVFLADVLYGESAETVAARPGWDAMTAVQNGDIVELDSDVASRWGPRIVDFAQAVADALRQFFGG